MPLISLCMIVRDEDRFLPGCLSSVEGVVDEIVVVDTGSVDDTPTIAEQYGAKVTTIPWQDDFAHARNVALAQATGDYVLVLDADERLVTDHAEEIRQACIERTADCFLLPLHNADRLDASPEQVLSGSRRAGGVTYLPRLLLRTPDLHWEGEVHENPRSWLALPGRRIERLEAPIVHYGYADEVVSQRQKVERNLDLLRMRCEREPDRPDPHVYIAKSHLQQGRVEDAHAELLVAWRLARGLTPEERLRPIISMMVVAMLKVLMREPAEHALPYLEEALGWGLDHPNVMYTSGVTLERLAGPECRGDELRRAEEVYRRGLEWRGVPLLPLQPHLQTWLLPLRLGIVRCKRGDPAGALKVLAPALAERPHDPALRVAVAEALTELDEPATALKTLEPVLNGAVSDAWWIAGQATHRLGDSDSAVTLLARARQIDATGESHRAHRGARLHDQLRTVTA